MCASVRLRSSSTWKIVTFRACTDQLSRNLTDILQLLKALQSIISRLGTNWTCHIEESLFKQITHLSISAPFYLAGSALCIVVWALLLWSEVPCIAVCTLCSSHRPLLCVHCTNQKFTKNNTASILWSSQRPMLYAYYTTHSNQKFTQNTCVQCSRYTVKFQQANIVCILWSSAPLVCTLCSWHRLILCR